MPLVSSIFKPSQRMFSIWLDALAAHLDPIPTASGQPRQYDGLDMSPAHFPASHPENFHYDVYNILQPVPEELKEKYDLVHVRLLVAALSKGDMNTAVDNLAQLLRKIPARFDRILERGKKLTGSLKRTWRVDPMGRA